VSRVSEHVRESATLTSLLGGEYPPDLIVADCSCGDEYLVAAGGNEYAHLEAAQAEHAAAAGGAR
jgi:hypothetical protein